MVIIEDRGGTDCVVYAQGAVTPATMNELALWSEAQALTTENATLREALEEIADVTRRQQLPITAQVNECARTALSTTNGEKNDG